MTDKARDLLKTDPMFNPPQEAVDAFPDECANCGTPADAFFIPSDYHEQDNPDPGVCTECGHHFGSGKPK